MKRYILSAIVLLAGAMGAMASDTEAESFKRERNLIKEGNELFGQGNYVKALQLYEQALTVNPSSEAALYNKAVSLLKLPNEDNKGTERDPRLQGRKLLTDIASGARNQQIVENSLYNLGNLEFNDENYPASIEMYKKVLRKNPANIKARQNLRLAQLKQQEQENGGNDDKQDQDKQQQEQEQKQQEQQQQQQQQQQQEQQQQQPDMTNNAEQILQTMQNKENQTRKKVNAQEVKAGGQRSTDKPW